MTRWVLAGDADQQPRAADTGGAAPLHLLQTAGTQLLRTAQAHGAGYLRQPIHALYHAADADAPLLTARNDLPRIAAQDRKIDL